MALVALILLAAFPYFEQLRNANELPRLIQAMSLVEAGEWAIDGPSRRGLALGPDVARGPLDARLYPNKPPGASVVGALAFVVARASPEAATLRSFTWWARLFGGVLPTLVIVGVAWGRLRGRYGRAVTATALILWVFGTPIFSYARLFYGHALAACLLYLGVVLLEPGARASSRSSGGASSRMILLRTALAGLAAGAAITVEYGAAFAGLPIAALLLWPLLRPGAQREQRLGAARRALAGLAGALVPVAALARYQRAVFGSPWSTGYHHAADPGFARLHAEGLLGLGAPRWDNVQTHLLSPNTGLLVWSPLVVVACVGLVHLARRSSGESSGARLRLAIFVMLALMGLGLSFQGGWRVGPRYLVVAFPLLIMGLAESISVALEHPRAWVAGLGCALIAAAAGASLVANALAATLWPHLDPTNIAEPFGAVLLPLLRGGYAPYGLPSVLPYGSALCIASSVLLGAAALGWVGSRARARATLAPILLGFGAGVLAVIVVIPRVVVAHPKSGRNLSFIERVYEPTNHAAGGPRAASKVLSPGSRVP